jgi:hypothetical protein
MKLSHAEKLPTHREENLDKKCQMLAACCLLLAACCLLQIIVAY